MEHQKPKNTYYITKIALNIKYTQRFHYYNFKVSHKLTNILFIAYILSFIHPSSLDSVLVWLPLAVVVVPSSRPVVGWEETPIDSFNTLHFKVVYSIIFAIIYTSKLPISYFRRLL